MPSNANSADIGVSAGLRNRGEPLNVLVKPAAVRCTLARVAFIFPGLYPTRVGGDFDRAAVGHRDELHIRCFSPKARIAHHPCRGLSLRQDHSPAPTASPVVNRIPAKFLLRVGVSERVKDLVLRATNHPVQSSFQLSKRGAASDQSNYKANKGKTFVHERTEVVEYDRQFWHQKSSCWVRA
jgi:hypothetical protein